MLQITNAYVQNYHTRQGLLVYYKNNKYNRQVNTLLYKKKYIQMETVYMSVKPIIIDNKFNYKMNSASTFCN